MGQCSSAPALPPIGGITAMHAAAANGNVIEILSIGEHDEKCGRALSIASTDRNASTPLHHAAFEGQLGSVRALLSLGANTRAVNSRKFTPLHLAASQGHAAVVQCLLVADASAARAQDKDGWTPLMCAAAKGHCNCINLLARAASNLEARSTTGSTALLIAAGACDANAVRTLLSLGANPAAANNNGCTAAHLAAQCAPGSVHASNCLYILRYLLEKGGPPDARARGGNCPIHLAAAAGSVEAVKLLLHYRADAYILNEQGLSPLQIAVEKGKTAVVNVLLPLEFPEPAVSADLGPGCSGCTSGESAQDGNANLCCICLDAPRQVAAVPCGHKSMCGSCAALAMKTAAVSGKDGGNALCPICRAAVMGLLRVYDA